MSVFSPPFVFYRTAEVSAFHFGQRFPNIPNFPARDSSEGSALPEAAAPEAIKHNINYVVN